MITILHCDEQIQLGLASYHRSRPGGYLGNISVVVRKRKETLLSRLNLVAASRRIPLDLKNFVCKRRLFLGLEFSIYDL